MGETRSDSVPGGYCQGEAKCRADFRPSKKREPALPSGQYPGLPEESYEGDGLVWQQAKTAVL